MHRLLVDAVPRPVHSLTTSSVLRARSVAVAHLRSPPRLSPRPGACFRFLPFRRVAQVGGGEGSWGRYPLVSPIFPPCPHLHHIYWRLKPSYTRPQRNGSQHSTARRRRRVGFLVVGVRSPRPSVYWQRTLPNFRCFPPIDSLLSFCRSLR